MTFDEANAVSYGSKVFFVNDARELICVDGDKAHFVADIDGLWALRAMAAKAIEDGIERE